MLRNLRKLTIDLKVTEIFRRKINNCSKKRQYVFLLDKRNCNTVIAIHYELNVILDKIK